MDDLSATIGAILSDPQKMEQLRAVAQSLGVNPDAPPPSSAPPPSAPQANAAPANSGFDPAAIASLIQGLSGMSGGGQGAPAAGAAPAAPAGGMPDLSQFSKLAGLFGSFNQSDKNVDLLRSLRPHFSPTRAGKIDDAVRIMQLIRMWPSLRDSGLLGSLGNLFGGGGK